MVILSCLPLALSLTSGLLAINLYRPRIDRQIAVLLQRISEAATTRSTVLTNDIMYWFAFDSMGEFAFNQDFGMMRRQEWHFAITLFRRALSLIGPFSPALWLIKIGFAFVPWFWNIGAWFGMLSFCNKQLEARTKLIRIASDTTAPTLTFLFYLIARNPEDANKIYTELADVDPMDLNVVSTLPHLNGTINEAMRLYSVTPTTVSRQTPPQGVMLGDTWIPGNTKVVSPRWVIFRRGSSLSWSSE
ncbi:MAG: hypothetical protein Q9184_005800 [Pyrenodesmia sp. 2 TL-2023]